MSVAKLMQPMRAARALLFSRFEQQSYPRVAATAEFEVEAAAEAALCGSPDD